MKTIKPKNKDSVPQRNQSGGSIASTRCKKSLYSTQRKRRAMDEADLIILKQLTEDCNIPAKDIVKHLKIKKIDLTDRAVRKRIKRLSEFGVIEHFAALISPEHSGMNFVRVVFVRFRNASDFMKRLHDYTGYVTKSPYCVFAARIRGEWDWVHYKCFPTKELADLEDDIFRSKFGDIMEEYRSYDAEPLKFRFNSLITADEVRSYLEKIART